MWDTPPHQQFNRSLSNERLFSFGGVNMSKLYIFLILEMFLYKSISKFLFTMECQSLPQEDVSQELKQWKFSFDQILYYLIIVAAILKPLVAGEIELNFFLIGLIPVVVSLLLDIFSYIKGLNPYILYIDFLFMEGLAIQINSWLCSLLGFIYLGYQIYLIKFKK